MVSGRRITLISISIHALLAEGDKGEQGYYRNSGNFNPRPPRGGRPELSGVRVRAKTFQSTPSSRRATSLVSLCALRDSISIHALLAEGDKSRIQLVLASNDFNPRPPRGGRPRAGRIISRPR